ncbi:MAG: hypothetical protein OHK93_005287 [Ramalina farinacea]|uniref:Isochorismatase-like domain-containing protein n=1 Tax=Ramalina farinacea TaxID=258253 RepID=A0AA43QW42_9LECA|nr:hypothetical protein [Ramalina farinacea]
MAPPQSGKSFRSLLGMEDSKPTPQESTLILIDAQNEYADGALAIVDVASSRAVISSLLSHWRQHHGNVVHVLHQTPQGAPLFTPGTALAEEFEELGVKEGEKVIHKQHPSAFTSTELDAYLSNDVESKKIVLVGYMAHVCISNTSRAAAEMGYDVSVVADGIGDRDIPGAKAGGLVQTVLAELGDVSATIVESKALLA